MYIYIDKVHTVCVIVFVCWAAPFSLQCNCLWVGGPHQDAASCAASTSTALVQGPGRGRVVSAGLGGLCVTTDGRRVQIAMA